MILKKGDLFRQAWKTSDESPMLFYVLDLNREKNSLKVECRYNGHTHVEDWDDLDITEGAFEIGEYTMMASSVDETVPRK